MNDSHKIQRILVIRRNRMGDMICTLPLLRALRTRFPEAHLKVLCEEKGELIALACGAVNEVQLLKKGINRLHTLLLNLPALRGCDLAIGVKAGFDRHLAAMVRWSGARVRIGYARGARSFYYNHPLPLPSKNESQIVSCMRLLAPLGIENAPIELRLDLPATATEFAKQLAREKDLDRRFLAVFNLSSNREQWPVKKYSQLGRLLLEKTGGLIGLSCLPEDCGRAEEIQRELESASVFVLQAKNPLELAAIFQQAHLLVTQEGGAAHLAAASGTPTLVLWSQYGPLEKWKSIAGPHCDLRATGSLETISVEDVWEAIQREFLLKR